MKHEPSTTCLPSCTAVRSSAAALWTTACLLSLVSITGCSCIHEPHTDASLDSTTSRQPDASQVTAERQADGHQPPKPTADNGLQQDLRPAGRPSPDAVCGHAVAFAGWTPDEASVRDILLVNDPGDNAAANIVNAWQSQPSKLPLHFGEQRPAVVLPHGGPFTVTGAVLVAPRDSKAFNGAIRMAVTVAEDLPDLSQDFSPRWPGLCGPTSAADVLFSMHRRNKTRMPDLLRGPGRQADEGVVRLITGGLEQISSESLTGRMGGSEKAPGVTANGIRLGLQSWLDEAEQGAWSAQLLWFHDAPGERSRQEQREFFGKLAAAVEAGGGAIVCLWPGVEFSSATVSTERSRADSSSSAVTDGHTKSNNSGSAASQADNSATRSASSERVNRRSTAGTSLPDAAFPQLPPAATESVDAPGRPEVIDSAQVVRDASSKIDSARQYLATGRADRGYEAAREAISLLHPAARRDPSLKSMLVDAQNICRACDLKRANRPADTDKPIEYR
jgi:hypothetical protein